MFDTYDFFYYILYPLAASLYIDYFCNGESSVVRILLRKDEDDP